MTLKGPLPTLTPSFCATLQKQILEACRNIASEHGLVVDDRGLQDINPLSGFEFGVRVGIALSDGEIFNPDKAMFETLAEHYGLDPDDFGREFSTGTETFRITGIEPRRPKYPVSAERLSDQRPFKFTAKNAGLYLKAKE